MLKATTNHNSMELSHITAILMTTLTLALIVIILFGFNKILGRSNLRPQQKLKLFFGALIFTASWVILVSFLSLTGVLAQFDPLPPRPLFLILVPLPFVIYLTFTDTYRQLLIITPKSWLINIQVFRVFVEVILWIMFLAGQVPIQMTFEEINFDILAGLTALPIGYLCFAKGKNRNNIAIAWNIFGLLLLLNILIIAMLSMPTSIRYFMNTPDSSIVAQFPYAFLPGVLVTVAYSMHIFSLRQLYLSR